LRAGSRSASAGTRRQPKATSHAASPDTSVTCSPEMLIRCVTPVRLKSCHSSLEIARCSPTASAARMPAAGVGPSTARKRSRTDSLACSMRSANEFLVPEPPLLAATAHVSGRADAALEEPRLVVEAVRIDETVRPAKTQREEPALAGMHAAREQRRRFLRDRRAIPGHEDLARQALAAGRRLDVELEAHRALAGGGKARDDADDRDVATLPVPARADRHAPVRPARGPEEADREARDERKPLHWEKQRAYREQPDPGNRGQRGLLLQEGSTGRERERRQGH
jgi:hypothetical protein